MYCVPLGVALVSNIRSSLNITTLKIVTHSTRFHNTRQFINNNIHINKTFSTGPIKLCISKMAQQVKDDNIYTDIRLPKNIKPIHYDLRLKPNFENFTFEGKVAIEYEADKQTDRVVLHSNALVIHEGHVKGEGISKLTKVTYSESTETATLDFDGPVFKSGTINLEFTGTLNDDMKGFYKTKFKIQDDVVYAATTQFESTDARRCLPCWDEPAIKATFTVSLVINPEISVNGHKYPRLALSNTNEVERQTISADEVLVKFEKTPIMSTYLLAVIVGPFEAVESTDGKRPVRVFAVPGKADQGKFALEVACKSLIFYEQYFDIPYPLPKMDLIAIPDFACGAMENWGLVTYRETALLVDPKNTAAANKQWIALVVAHELAHQWFGNLVTMEWWTHLWLNEGFATFMEFMCVDSILPEYEIWTQFTTDAYSSALELDSLHNSHAIEVPVNHPDEINQIFDQISYEKGASVIRMLYNYIGDDAFRKGMHNYLEKFAYKNASTEDLWVALEAASGKAVTKLMSGWTSQKGYPWLSVSMSRQENKATLTLEQNKFSANGQVSTEDSALTWVVPIDVSTSTAPNQAIPVGLLESRKGQLTFELTTDGWVKLNPGTIGLYRAVYDDEMKSKLLSAINDQSLPAMDRLGYQNDLYSLCQPGKVSSVDLLKLLNAFKDEENYTVWVSINKCLGHLSLLMSNTDYEQKFNAFGRSLLEKIFKKLTWDATADKKHTDAMLRSLIIARLVALENKDVIQECLLRFRAHVAKTTVIPADLRAAIYRAAAAHGDEQDFNNLFDIYHSSNMQEEKDRVSRALGFSKDAERRKRVVDFILSDAVRNQDKVFVVMTFASSNPKAGWQFFLDNKAALLDSCGAHSLKIRLVQFVTSCFVSLEKAQEIEAYFKENKIAGTEVSLQQSLEKVRSNAEWLKRDHDVIKQFLESTGF